VDLKGRGIEYNGFAYSQAHNNIPDHGCYHNGQKTDQSVLKQNHFHGKNDTCQRCVESG
jgi:hypothetical protein